MNDNLVQEFRMGKMENRLVILGDWVENTLLQLQKLDGTPKQTIDFIARAHKKAQQFINRPIMRQSDPIIDWYLPKNWFKSILAQCLKGVNDQQTKKVYRALNWNYKTSINPISGDGSTLIGF